MEELVEKVMVLPAQGTRSCSLLLASCSYYQGFIHDLYIFLGGGEIVHVGKPVCEAQ